MSYSASVELMLITIKLAQAISGCLSGEVMYMKPGEENILWIDQQLSGNDTGQIWTSYLTGKQYQECSKKK